MVYTFVGPKVKHAKATGQLLGAMDHVGRLTARLKDQDAVLKEKEGLEA